MSNKLESAVKIMNRATIRDLKAVKKELETNVVDREATLRINFDIALHFKGKPNEQETYLLKLIQEQAKIIGNKSLANKAGKALRGGKLDTRIGVAISGEDTADLEDWEWSDWVRKSLYILEEIIELLE